MADTTTPGITGDDAAIFSLNTTNDDSQQQEDPFYDARGLLDPNAQGKGRVKSGTFVPKEPLFQTTPGAKNVQW